VLRAVAVLPVSAGVEERPVAAALPAAVGAAAPVAVESAHYSAAAVAAAGMEAAVRALTAAAVAAEPAAVGWVPADGAGPHPDDAVPHLPALLEQGPELGEFAPASEVDSAHPAPE
jgi:hypothetical protein